MRGLENAGQRGGRNCDGALRCTARRGGGRVEMPNEGSSPSVRPFLFGSQCCLIVVQCRQHELGNGDCDSP